MVLLERSAEVYLRAAAAASPLSDAEAAGWQAAGEELLERLWQHLR